MRERWKMNAMRSGLVVFGAFAFGYLTLQLGFRPFLERAQRTLDLELQQQQQQKESEQHPSQSQSDFQEQPFDFSDTSSSSNQH